MMRSNKKNAAKNTLHEKRAAGTLLHITSLPGPFGIGDLGPEAQKFADALQRAGQTYWQLLPLNPVERSASYSPYSSVSSIAGNTLLISPDLLVKRGYLKKHQLQPYKSISTDRVDYAKSELCKAELLDKAFENFTNDRQSNSEKRFSAFCKTEAGWLDDFSLYVVLKKLHGGQPWNEWPAELRNRMPAALRAVKHEHETEINKIKFGQFIFFEQWYELKNYCNAKNILLFGDLPFYVSYDSVDVWSNRSIFSLDRRGNPDYVAGVPPDYFNEDGQLWGMPVFRWDILRKTNYAWWIERLKKNTAMYDILRLDHFRAFADYWAVSATEKTARNGRWKKGPGDEFFNIALKQFGSLPFVAEDLGDINDKVYKLRDDFQFPGMKVLHFAFGDNMPASDYIPHNYSANFVVYTGTHDNNTTRGWFRKDLSEKDKQNVRRYLSEKITDRNIHHVLIKLAFSSVARTVIVPIQDILGLDERSRINAPATVDKNWLWRMLPDAFTTEHERWLKDLTVIFNR